MDRQTMYPITATYTKAVLAAGTTTTVSTTNAIVYAIRGKIYSVSALSNQATPTTDAVTGAAFLGVKANKGCVFLYGFNAAGTLLCVQGSIVDLDASGAFVVASQFGSLPTDFCPFAYLVIKAGSTADATTGWVQGSSNQASVTGITYGRQDVSTLPDRPQIS